MSDRWQANHVELRFLQIIEQSQMFKMHFPILRFSPE